ncbi:MAG: S8 family serine peptidase [bacterium]
MPQTDEPLAEPQRPTGRKWWALLPLLATLAATPASVAGPNPKPDGPPPAASKVAAPESPSDPAVMPAAVVEVIGASKLRLRGIDGSGVTVALVDTGVAPVPALADPDKVVAMVDLSLEAGVPEARYLDTYGHGTHMAGIIAGRSPDGAFQGVAPGASLVSVKVGDNSGAVDVSQVIAGIDWVVDHAHDLDIRVLNLSYGTDSTQDYRVDPLAFAVEEAWRAGIVVVVAVGNDGRGIRRLADPALDPFVIAVAAADTARRTIQTPAWSTSGDGSRNPDVSAPGAHIVSLRAPGSRVDVEHPEGYVSETLFKGSGSSQAAAVVSGAVALLLEERPWLTPDQVKALLRGAAEPIGGVPEEFQGRGRIDVFGASKTEACATSQAWQPSSGSGALELARGSARVVIGGVPLSGEITTLGEPWPGQLDGAKHWAAGDFDGAHWTGAAWRGAAWREAAWTGAHWTGASWLGAKWTSASWRGDTWTGAKWTSATWTGAAWRDGSWTGAAWRDVSWSGAAWRGASW